jgi:adenylosuccinate synthase
MTRAYATRHGAGPFPTEVAGIPYPNVVENTNVTNDWQGGFRFGILDLPSLSSFIYRDMDEIRNYSNMNFMINLGITCMDQVDEKIRVETGPGVQLDLKHEELFDILRSTFFDFGFYQSNGPTRNTIDKIV